jgi:dTDP-4-dehydrorhamnose reductase
VRAIIVHSERTLQVELARQLQQRGTEVLCVEGVELDALLADAGAGLDAGFAPGSIDPDDDCIVIDCASREGAVGEALTQAAFERLIAHCAKRRWQYVLLSDSRVFPSGGKQRFRELDEPQPSSAAGASLVERERYLATHWERHIILRSGPQFAAAGENPLTDLLYRLREGGSLAAAQGVRFAPTPAADLARVLAAMCDQLACNARCWGIYHYHSSDPATGYEFAEVVLAAAAQYWPIGADRAPLQAAVDDPVAGLYPLLNCQRIRDTFGIQQLPWRKAIPQLLKTIYAGETP